MLLLPLVRGRGRGDPAQENWKEEADWGDRLTYPKLMCIANSAKTSSKIGQKKSGFQSFGEEEALVTRGESINHSAKRQNDNVPCSTNDRPSLTPLLKSASRQKKKNWPKRRKGKSTVIS